jgi:hypothetical protein
LFLSNCSFSFFSFSGSSSCILILLTGCLAVRSACYTRPCCSFYSTRHPSGFKHVVHTLFATVLTLLISVLRSRNSQNFGRPELQRNAFPDAAAPVTILIINIKKILKISPLQTVL